MEDVLKSDIFFFVTTIAVALVSAGLIVVFVYLIKILNDFLFISRKVKEEGEKIIKDVEAVREKAEKEGLRMKKIFAFFKKRFTIKKGHKK